MKFKIFISSLICAFVYTTVSAKILTDPPESGTLTGIVTDKTDGSPLIGVTVTIPDLKNGTTTNNDGKYILNHVPKGIFLVQVRYIGYATINQKVDFTKTTTLNFQMQMSSIETGEVVITGVARATELKKSPIPIVAVSKQALDEHAGAGNVIDQIANLPGVSAVTTGPNVSKPFIHGLGYNRVITSVDGIRQEGQQWGDEHGVEVDQNAVDRIEVIKGPASLTYGSDAIGGVVNMISPAPVAEGKILGSVQGLYGTNNGLYNGSFRLQGNQNGLVWGTVVSAKGAKDYQNQHDGRVYNTAYQEKDARVMLGLNKSWGYSYFNASVFDDKQEIPDGSRDSISRQFTKQVTEDDSYRPIVSSSELNSYSISPLYQRVQLYRIYNNSSFIFGDNNSLNVNLGYQKSHRREFTHPTATDVPGLNLNLDTYTYDVKYNFTFAHDYESSFGLNGMYQKNTLGAGTDFPIPNYHQFDIGPFFFIKKSFGKLDVSTGGRFDSRSFTGEAAYVDNTNPTFPSLYTGSNPTTAPNVDKQFDALSKTFTGFSGSFGATYNVSNQFLIKGNIARGFRAPSIAELSANGADPGSQIYHTGNKNFVPEFSLQEDIGAFLTLPEVTASAELFNNDISNYIFQEQLLNPDGSPVITNGYNTFSYVQSKAQIYGGELNLDIHPVKWLHFQNAMSLTYGQNKGTGGTVPDSLKYLPFIPPLHTHSELRGNFDKGFGVFKKVYAFVGFDHFSAQNHFFAAYGTETYTAGYNLLSAGIGSNIVNAAGKKVVELFLEGTNLANVNYQSNMSRLKYFDNPNGAGPGVAPGIFNMGRNISFKVVVPFDL
ncbi:iron complex outermembrane receptor protein [Mucilaginibacter gracilis]|uniref:Iron complex outermembrane receptor protein n=1 Tax=Mucilaginibacter gracilis TaxID=423350 RepID=A0A495IWR2_9SPHI|nr:TonB-dependent receptor [Mucilaginibacter gracilis]RKR81177.1 iron complex outermembrane receptor protein [Mucilaginibacter gracilis]